MTQQEISSLLQEISGQSHLKPEQIPELSLYIDQILTLFSCGSAEERALTKSMVNNYSKEKMLRPMKGKKYSREQVLQLLLVCRLKSVLSMEQIKSLTQALMEQEEGEERLEEILNAADCQKQLFAETVEFFWQRSRTNLSEDLCPSDSAALILAFCQLSELFAQAACRTAECTFFQKEKKEKNKGDAT